MKKLLLFAALAATTLGVNAQSFGEIFEITDEKGNVLENGSTIVVDTYKDIYLGALAPMVSLESVCDFYAKNISEEPYNLAYDITRVAPSLAEVGAGEGGFGDYQACYTISDGSASGVCTMAKDGDPQLLYIPNDIDVDVTVDMAFHQLSFTSLDPVTVKFTYYVIEGGEKLEGAQFDLYIKLTHLYDITLGVDGIDAEAADAEYFSLQGVRVATPVKGQLYIVRQGGKTAKVIL